jgi:hypothetical protein
MRKDEADTARRLYPALYRINTRVFLTDLSCILGPDPVPGV